MVICVQRLVPKIILACILMYIIIFYMGMHACGAEGATVWLVCGARVEVWNGFCRCRVWMLLTAAVISLGQFTQAMYFQGWAQRPASQLIMLGTIVLLDPSVISGFPIACPHSLGRQKSEKLGCFTCNGHEGACHTWRSLPYLKFGVTEAWKVPKQKKTYILNRTHRSHFPYFSMSSSLS